MRGLVLSSTNKRTPNLAKTSPVAPIDTNSDIEAWAATLGFGKVKLPSKESYMLNPKLRSRYDIHDLEFWYQLLITDQESRAVRYAAEMSILDQEIASLKAQLITERQRICDLIEAEIPKKKDYQHDRHDIRFDPATCARWNECVDQTLAVIRRQRGKDNA